MACGDQGGFDTTSDNSKEFTVVGTGLRFAVDLKASANVAHTALFDLKNEV